MVRATDQEGWEIRNFTKNEYNAESQNWSIVQDTRGFVYFANNAGLLEFDGVENHPYKLRKKLNFKKEDDLTDFILSV